ncbi:SdpI family protein [Candidatus Woesearchaeota archaeon]|nr:SdpI family protein [Candidatus Woesearchaeota archaeon]
MRKIQIITIAIIVLSFVIAVYLHPLMPERMASHWNARGEVNGYMPKFWALFLMPFVVAGCFILFMFIPRIDPLKKNIDSFRKYYDGFILVVTVFMAYVFMLTVLWNLGVRYDMTRAILPAMGLLFYYCAVLIKHAKPNWFIGIRTPWTLSNKVVWEKTHKLGAKIFKAFAVLFLMAAFIGHYSMHVVLWPLLAGVLYLTVYSYVEFRKIKKQ